MQAHECAQHANVSMLNEQCEPCTRAPKCSNYSRFIHPSPLIPSPTKPLPKLYLFWCLREYLVSNIDHCWGRAHISSEHILSGEISSPSAGSKSLVIKRWFGYLIEQSQILPWLLTLTLTTTLRASVFSNWTRHCLALSCPYSLHC